jgi:hypothetical protein
MKARFIFAAKASDVYNAVSRQFILPTLDILPGLGCMNQAPDHEIRARIDELHKLRCSVSSETDNLTRKVCSLPSSVAPIISANNSTDAQGTQRESGRGHERLC